MMKFVSYLRVSTREQSRSGLGIEAQREAVSRYLQGARPLAEYVEIESGRKADRVRLRKALDHCRRTGAVLVIAKLDRLTRSARFLLELVDSEVELAFCDLPQLSGPQGKFMLASMANVAELETAMIGQRTRDALAAAKARGVRLGGPLGARPLVDYVRHHGNARAVAGKAAAADRRAEPWRDTISAMLAEGLSLNEIARRLDGQGERTALGGRFTATAVRRIVKRLGLADGPAIAKAA